ncbi:MAG: hypothetical protein ACKPJD_01810, partial [Planctomycetaceae bacterium]
QTLEFFQRAFKASQRTGGENRMPNCLEALFEQGVEQGLERGLEQGLERGLEQGLGRGLEQGLGRGLEQGLGLGIEKGVVVGRIRTLQEVVGQTVTAQADLLSRSLEELQQQTLELELLLRQVLR